MPTDALTVLIRNLGEMEDADQARVLARSALAGYELEKASMTRVKKAVALLEKLGYIVPDLPSPRDRLVAFLEEPTADSRLCVFRGSPLLPV